jgi:hypothetical protein
VPESIQCVHCGKELSPNGEQPCPYCGKTGRKFEVGLRNGVGFRDDLAVGLTQGETGRFALHSDSRNPTDVVLIEKHIRSFLNGEFAAFEEYVASLVDKFDNSITGTQVFYRGIDSIYRNNISGNRIGPSPSPKDGRYNTKEEKALYLIDNVHFLAGELGSSKLLVQEFEINLAELRVADLSSENKLIDNSLALLFQMTERGKLASGLDFEAVLQNKGKSRYLLSQRIAASFRAHGWQALYIPGVHGKPGMHYRNLVIFGPCVDRWREWAKGNYRSYSNMEINHNESA